MDHGGEAARPTTVGSAGLGMAGTVHGGEAHMSAATFRGQRLAGFDDVFEPSEAAYRNSAELARDVRVAYADIGVFWPRPGPPVGVVLVDLQHRADAGHGIVLADLLPGGAEGGEVFVGLLPDWVYDDYGYYGWQPRPGAGGRGEVFVGPLPGGGGVLFDNSSNFVPQTVPGTERADGIHGALRVEATAAAYHNSAEFARQVPAATSGGALPVPVFHHEPGTVVLAALRPGGVEVVYSGDYVLQPRPGAGHGEEHVDVLPDDARNGQSFLGHQLPGRGIAAYDDYAYYALQPRPDAGHGEVLVDLLRYGYYMPNYMWQPSPATGHGEVFVGAVFDNSGNFFAQAQQTLPGIGRAEGIAGALRGRNLGAAYSNLSRLLPLAGIGACSVAVNGLAAGPGSPAAAFHLFVLLLAGLFLVILNG